MTARVLLVAASAAFIIGVAVRLRRGRWGTEFTEGIADGTPAQDASFVAAAVPQAPSAPSFVYKATLKLPKTTSEILIVGSEHAAPAGSVTWLPWFYRQFEQFLSPGEPVICFVGDEMVEWTSHVFPKVQELVWQAETIKNQNQSSESDEAKLDWIKKYNHKNRIAGVEVNEALTSGDFPALHGAINREYDVIELDAGGIAVTLYSLFKQVSVTSKGLVSVEFIENLSDVKKYVEEALATTDTNSFIAMPQDVQQAVQNKISKLRPAYLRGDAYTYFEILPLLLSKTNGFRSIPGRNHKWALTIHNSIQRAEGHLAVVVVGAAHLGRAGEMTPDSILDALESLGYRITPVDMSANKRNGKRVAPTQKSRETERRAEAKAAWTKANA